MTSVVVLHQQILSFYSLMFWLLLFWIHKCIW